MTKSRLLDVLIDAVCCTSKELVKRKKTTSEAEEKKLIAKSLAYSYFSLVKIQPKLQGAKK